MPPTEESGSHPKAAEGETKSFGGDLTRLQSALGDDYALEGKLGQGGMATVYLAQDRTHRRKLAIKVLSSEVASALGSERFLHEIDVAASLTHPNILPLYASGEAEGYLYYVMPYVEDESLRDRLLQDGHLPLDEAIRIVGEIADALAHAHDQGIIHRDIKPENILFIGGHAVVADFGIAKALDVAGGERLTQTGLVVGTPTYMSPEQAGGALGLDSRSDQYSLGCLAYEMLGGEPPFTGPTPQAVLARHAVDPVPEIRTIRPSVPEGVAKAIERALAKVPADRFPRVGAFAEALTKASTAEAIEAELRKRETEAGRRRARWAAGAIGVLALGAWGLTLLVGPTYRRLAVLPPINLLNDPGQEHVIQGVHNALIDELQQARVSVKARQSTMQYRNSDHPPRAIAEELGVDALLEPSVSWGADSVEIEVRLVDGQTEEYVEAPLMVRGAAREVLGLYRELVRQVIEGLQLALTPETEARLAIAEPIDPAAYEDYLNGQVYWNTLSPVGLETALRYFEQALDKAPDFAQAHAGIAWVWTARQQMGFTPPWEAAPRAREALAQALAIDSTRFEVQYVAAVVQTWVDWDWEVAEETFLRGITLNPEFADLRAYYAHLLMILGRMEESAEQMRLAMELDPIKPLVQALYAVTLMYGAGQVDEAIPFFQESIRINPMNPLAQTGLQAAYQKKGMQRESLFHAASFFSFHGDTLMVDALLAAYEERGHEYAWRLAAERMIEVANETYVNPTEISVLYDFAGDVDDAYVWLERAIEVRDPNVPYLNFLYHTPHVRGDPRFREIQRRANLPEG
jgi:serine/threonine-protein kinase